MNHLRVPAARWRPLILAAIGAMHTGCLSRECKSPQPVLRAGKDTGMVKCAGGWTHRARAADISATVPRDTTCDQSYGHGHGESQCAMDRECTAQAFGRCVTGYLGPPGGLLIPCHCRYGGCVRDADCRSDEICVPGEFAGECVRATCTTEADCGDGLCASGGVASYSCQESGDECNSAADCGWREVCTDGQGSRVCRPGLGHPAGPVTGRPFLVRGLEQTAGAAPRSDWAGAETPSLEGISAERRKRLAARWTMIALMEHASIAAFARFALHLLSVGAPAELIEATHVAMADETRHAKTAFALASAYGGEPVGPTALPIDGALDDTGALDIVRLVFHEGCVGETVAAVEAAEGACHATDPLLRAVLRGIAADETRHAALAWRFVAWACANIEGAVGVVRDELDAELALAPLSGESRDADLLVHGLVDDALRARLRAAVLSEVVVPCVPRLSCTRDTTRAHRVQSLAADSGRW